MLTDGFSSGQQVQASFPSDKVKLKKPVYNSVNLLID